jgi:hypothetical protein
MRSNARWFVTGFASLALVVLGLSAVHSTARAGVDADVRAGVVPDADAVAIGGGVLAPINSHSKWYLNPNVEVAMGDRKDIVSMNGDVHYDFAHETNTSFWVGGGPAVLVTNPEVGNTHTDLGMNVLTGVGARRGQVRPFAQIRGTVADNSMVALAGGIRF